MNSIEKLRKILTKKYQNQFDLDIGEGNFVLLTIISGEFNGLNRSQRLEQVNPLILNEGLIQGIVYLYTPQEADMEGIMPSIGGQERAPISWQDAVDDDIVRKKILLKNSLVK